MKYTHVHFICNNILISRTNVTLSVLNYVQHGYIYMNISFEINYETSNSALIICEFLSIHSKLSTSTKGLLENYYISIRIYVIPTIQITNGECLGCKLIKRTIKIYCQLSCGSKICIPLHCHICNIKQV